MINDQTIDATQARYYCLFADKEITKFLKDVNNHDLMKKEFSVNFEESEHEEINEGGKVHKNQGSTRLGDGMKAAAPAKSPSFLDTITKKADELKGAAAAKAQSLQTGAADQIGAMASQAVNTAIQNVDQDKIDQISHAAGEAAAKGAIDGLDQAKINDIASQAATSAANSALKNLDPEAVQNVASQAGAAAAKAAVDNIDQSKVNQIAASAANSAADAFTANAAQTLKDIGHAAVPYAVGAGILFALYKSYPWITSKIKFWSEKMKASKNTLASCTFKTTNGNLYTFAYNLDTTYWTLSYVSPGFLDKVNTPSTEECDEFVKTQFCKKFIAQCKKYAEVVLLDKNNFAILKKTCKDKNASTLLSKIEKNMSAIQHNMFNGVYKN